MKAKKQVKEKEDYVDFKKGAEGQEEKPTAKAKSHAVIYTYVGGGEDSPRIIEFMGLQKFIRGQATEVTDPTVLAKLATHACFVEGEVDPESIHEYDETAKKEADEQRKKDEIKNTACKKKYGTA